MMNTVPIQFLRRILFSLLLLMLVGAFSSVYAAPLPVTFQNVFYSKLHSQFLNGELPVTASLKVGNNVLYQEKFTSVLFKQGVFTIKFGGRSGQPFPSTVLNSAGVFLAIQTSEETATFTITSVPYAFRSRYSEQVRYVDARVITGNFTGNLLGTSLAVRASPGAPPLFVLNSAGNIGVGAPPDSLYLMNVSGTVNASAYFVNGIPLQNVFSWRPAPLRPVDIFTINGGLGIGTVFPDFTLHVAGTVQAKAFLIRGLPLVSSLIWKNVTGNGRIPYVYFPTAGAHVGIGTGLPLEALEVAGAIRVGATSSPNPGTIRYTTDRLFEGYRQNTWGPLGGVVGVGQTRRVGLWGVAQLGTTPNSVVSSPFLTLGTGAKSLAIGSFSTAPTSVVAIQESLPVSSTPTVRIRTATKDVFVLTGRGNVAIGTSNFKEKMTVGGLVNASQYYINGDILGLAFSLHDHWQRVPRSRGIYYLAGNVGIGRPDPTSLLEIAQPNGAPNVDPKISFVNARTGQIYSMGVSARSQGTFRIERGYALGGSAPIFVAQQDRFGIGVDPPRANLNVSGNRGVVFKGEFGTPGNLPVSGIGTRFQWYPPRASFVLGTLDEPSSLTATPNPAWNLANLGLFSIGIGHNTLSSGNLSTVIGGNNNGATGAYATALGGVGNKAYGDFSLVMGRNSVASRHGSFVWTDASGVRLSTIAERQFLIRADSGVGIGTSLTTQTATGNFPVSSALTVSRNALTGDVVRFRGSSTANSFLLGVTGNVRMGWAPRTPHVLTVGGPLAINRQDNRSFVTVQGYPTVALGGPRYVFSALGLQALVTPSMSVDASGNVGIGMYTDLPFFSRSQNVSPAFARYFLQIASGSIAATVFAFPTGETISPRPPNYVWNYRNTTPNIYFVSGNVAIGLTTPNRHLLLLSDKGSTSVGAALDPVISFNQYNTSTRVETTKYSVGIGHANPRVLKVFNGTSIAASGVLSVSGNRVGILTDSPRQSLEVNGNVFTPKLLVTTTNASSTYVMNVGGDTAVNRLFLNGSIVSAGGTPFQVLTSPTRLFYDTALDPDRNLFSYVGIGTRTPSVPLEIKGTFNIAATTGVGLFVNTLRTNSDVFTDLLKLRDTEDASIASLFINKNNLLLQTDRLRSLSDVFSPGSGPSGNIVLWATGPNIPTFTFPVEAVGLHWQAPSVNRNAELQITGNILVHKSIVAPSSFAYTNTFGLGGVSPFVSVTSNISHDGILSHSVTHTAKRIALDIGKWATLTPASKGVVLTGWTLKMANPNPSVYMNSQSQAIALNVDVTDVAVQRVADGGSAYSAIFLAKGPNDSGTVPIVGIGKNPSTELDVKGTVSANFFVISNRLTVTTLNMSGVLDMRSLNKVGFGTLRPAHTLDVVGLVSANVLRVGGLTGSSFLISPAKLSINNANNGFVGMGTTTPVAQWQLQRTFSALLNQDFHFQGVYATLNVNANRKMNAWTVNVRSASDRNFLGEISRTTTSLAKGIGIDLSELVSGATVNRVVGMDVRVSTGNAASFMGGPVGVGVTDPVAGVNLWVEGTLMGSNIGHASLVNQQAGASVNYLTVPAFVNIKQTALVNNIRVRSLYQDRLAVGSTVKLPTRFLRITGGVLGSNIIATNSVVGSLRISQVVTANSGVFTTMGIRTATPDQGLAVLKGITANGVLVSRNVFAGGVSANRFFRVSDVGTSIGRLNPTALLDVFTASPVRPYAVADTRTWNPVRLQTFSVGGGHATGVVFLDDLQDSTGVGAGILALPDASAAPTGSALVFITDSRTGAPQERMRILQSGRIGIGTSTPLSELQVSGSMHAQSFSLDSRTRQISLKKLSSVGGLAVSASYVTVQSTANIKTDLYVNRSLFILPNSAVYSQLSQGALTIRSSGGAYALRYAVGYPGNVTVSGNVGETIVAGVVGAIPYYDSFHTLRDSTGLSRQIWTLSGVDYARFNVAAPIAVPSSVASPDATFGVVAGFGSTTPNVKYTAQTVGMIFQNRTTLATNRFVGTGITMSGGTLKTGEKAVGVRVNTNLLKTTTVLPSGGTVKGVIRPAIFMAGVQSRGTVLISTTPNNDLEVPLATLHIKSNKPMMTSVGRGANSQVFFVNAAGQVGVGAQAPISKFSISVTSNTAPGGAFAIRNSAGTGELFHVMGTGNVGVGTSTPGSTLTVVSDLKADAFSGVTFAPTHFSMGLTGQPFVVKGDLVGVGTTDPTAQLHLVKTYKRPADLTKPVILQHLSVSHNANVTKSLTGIALAVTTDARTQLGSDTTAVTVKGLTIDLSGVELTDGAQTAIGLYSAVSSTGSGTRYPAIFMGGNVGIGLSNPAHTLDITGNIRARNVIASVTLNIQAASFNRVILFTKAPFIGKLVTSRTITPHFRTLQIDTKHVAPSVFVMQGLVSSRPTANFTVLTAATSTYSSVIRVGRTTPVGAEILTVSGSALISRSFFVTQNIGLTSLIATRSLQVSVPLNLKGSGVMNASGTMNAVTLMLRPGPTPNTRANYGSLFVASNAVKPLEYVFGSTTVNLSARRTGAFTKVPVFVQGNAFTDTALLSWVTSANYYGSTLPYSSLVVGTTNVLTAPFALKLQGSALSSVVTDTTVSSVGMSFANRTNISGNPPNTYRGVNVTGTQRLGTMRANDLVYGVYVDTSTVKDITSTLLPQEEDSSVVGKKAAAIFLVGTGSSGNVVIEPTHNYGTALLPNPVRGSAELHVTSRVPGLPVFRVDTLAFNNVLIVSSNANIAVGTVPGKQRLVVLEGAAQEPMLLGTGSTDQPLLYVGKVGGSYNAVGLGTTTPTHILTVANSNASLPSLQLVGSSITDVVSNTGLVGVGTKTPQAHLHVVRATTAPYAFEALSNAKKGLVVSGNGRIGIRAIPSLTFALLVSRNILSTANGSPAGYLPGSLATLAATEAGYGHPGFLSLRDSGYAFMGLRKTGTYLQWGQDSDLVVETGVNSLLEVMRLKKSGRIGFGTDVPSATVHIVGRAGVPTLKIEASKYRSLALLITEDGRIGIATSDPKATLTIAGTFQANSLVNAVQTGTLLEAPAVTVSSNAYRAKNFDVTTTVYKNQAVSLSTIQTLIGVDTAKSVSAMAVYVTGNAKLPGVTAAIPPQSLYGVRVRIPSYFRVDDPTFHNVPGHKYAAVFLGGGVGIGRVPSESVVTLTDGVTRYRTMPSLQVYAMDTKGKSTATGNIMGFSSYPTVVSGVTIKGSTLNINALGTRIATSSVSSRAFMSAGLSYDDSEAVFSDLLTNNIISTTNGGLYRVVNDYSGYTPPVGTAAVIRKILDQHVNRSFYRIKTIGTGAYASSNIYLVSGKTYNTDLSVMTPGAVGIGFRDAVPMGLTAARTLLSQIDKELVVGSGDMRIGVATNAEGLGTAGFGKFLYFSGGPLATLSENSDNSDPMWLARYNDADSVSTLRVSVGDLALDGAYSAKFTVGGLASWKSEKLVTVPALTVHATLYSDPVVLAQALQINPNAIIPGTRVGRVGIGVSNPLSVLHVAGSGSTTVVTSMDAVLTTRNAVFLLENRATANNATLPACTLALKLSGQGQDETSSYMAFMVPSVNAGASISGALPSILNETRSGPKAILGAIQINATNTTVQYSSAAADYAEYIPQVDANDVILPGEVIGIVDGRVSRDTQKAQQIMVMSSSPVIVGNAKPLSKGQALVSFMGQVKVRVTGVVHSGDYLIASGHSDGLAVAVSPTALSPLVLGRVVGRALGAKSDDGVGRVNTLIGFPYEIHAFSTHLKLLRDLHDEVATMALETTHEATQYTQILGDRQKLIDQLQAKVLAKRSLK